jgi:hypothetical protein
MVKKEPNYQYHVLFAVTSAFLLVFTVNLAAGKLALLDTKKSEDTLTAMFKGDSVSSAFIGWGVIALVLFSASSFDGTASIAAAFAWLILVAAILLNGQQILKIMGATTSTVSKNNPKAKLL